MIYKQKLCRRVKQSVSLLLILCQLGSFGCMSVYAAEDQEDEPQIMVSMGDSYSAGEGIEDFYGQEKILFFLKVKDPDWVAHRSKNSWPGMLKLPTNEGPMADKKNRGKYWYFVAASGAETKHLEQGFLKECKHIFFAEDHELKPQLEIFDQFGPNEVDYVTLTLGGNDAGFSKIIEACVLGVKGLNQGALADRLNSTWNAFYEKGGIKDKLRDSYVKIAESAGTEAQIIVAGYPKLIYKEGSGFFFSKEEAKDVNDSVTKFNKEINKIVDSCSEEGMKISFVSVEEEFDGHEAYSEKPFINRVMLLPKSEDIYDKFPSAYSMHPNKDGAIAYAECVQDRINEIEEEKAAERAKEKEAEEILLENPKAKEEEINAEAKHFSGVVLQPEDVVLKLFDALQKGDYERAVECYDPATEQQLDFWGGIAASIVGFFTGNYRSWGQLLLEEAGATEVDVIECYSKNLMIESNLDLFAEWLPKIPGLNNLFCTEADVYVKYRYKYEDEYYTHEETCHVRRYEWSGWRIEP